MATPTFDRGLRFSTRYEAVPQSSFTPDTAYTGSEGHIDILTLDDEALAGTDSRSSSPALTLSSSNKSPLSARLFSSALQNAQPAAAALTRSRSVLQSRAKSIAAWTSTFNTNSGERNSQATNKIFGDLFNGESAPVRLGVILPPSSPSKEREESEFVMDYTPTFTERPSLGRRRTSIGERRNSQAPSKQSWLSRKLGASTTTLPASVPEHDELLTLSINNELFPDGPADSCSPSAFNDLLLNATSLLERMQSAYREKTNYIASIQPELEAQREEVEESETRAQHLKLQLEDMSRQLQEHESAMKQMTIQLADEKLKVQQLRQDPNTIRVVEASRPQWRHKRTSNGSASDSGFESDLDRDSESVVSDGSSQAWSPTASDANERHVQHASPAWLQRHALYRGSNNSSHTQAGHPMSNNVLHLQDENHRLRRQVDEMQVSLQGCIDLLDIVKV